MTESEPDWPGLGAQADEDPLANRLLAARRALSAQDIDPDILTRLHLRFMAICTSLKMPTANPVRGARRLDRLIADAEFARRNRTDSARRGSGRSDSARRGSARSDSAGPDSAGEQSPS